MNNRNIITILLVAMGCILSPTALLAGEAELKASAQAFLAAQAALEKVVQLEKQWNKRWVGRKLTQEENQEAEGELSQLKEIGGPAVEARDETREQFKAQIAESGIEVPDGTSWSKLAQQIAGGTISIPDSKKSQDGQGENIHAEVRLLKKEKHPANSHGKLEGVYIYTVEAKISRSAGFDSQFVCALTISSGSDTKPLTEGGVANTGVSAILARKGETSATAILKINSIPQTVSVRFSTTQPGFMDDTERTVTLE